LFNFSPQLYFPYLGGNLQKILDLTEIYYKNFGNYRNIIKSEPEKFIKDLESIFEIKRD